MYVINKARQTTFYVTITEGNIGSAEALRQAGAITQTFAITSAAASSLGHPTLLVLMW